MADKASAAHELLSPPGDTIQETIDVLGMSQVELAERTGLNKKSINRIIKGIEPISHNTALLLERVLGIPVDFWLERERIYRQELMRIESEEALLLDREWLKRFPVNEMRKLGWIEAVKDPIELMKAMLSFFAVGSPQQWERLYIKGGHAMAFRMSLVHSTKPGALSAWLRQGELQAQRARLRPYDARTFLSVLEDVKELVRKQPADYKDRLQNACSYAGVAVEYTPCLPGVVASGAARWVRNGSTPLIQLSGRFKTNDHFWFSFFHEAGHILLHGKKLVFIEEIAGAVADDQKETGADTFAVKQLFPAEALAALCEDGIDETTIRLYAQRYGTHPAIIAGRLEHEGLVRYGKYRHLKVSVEV
jgi:addiction module HigA family antidote